MASSDEEICAAITRLAMAGDGIVLGLGLGFLAVRTWIKYCSNSKALRDVEETPLVTIDGLVKKLNKPDGHGMVIVRGIVAPESINREVLLSQHAMESAVCIEKTQTYLYNEWRGLFGWGSDRRALLGWGSLKEQVSLSRRKVPFVLVENNNIGQDAATVRISMDEMNHPLPLVTVHRQLLPVQTSSYTFLQAVFGRRYPIALVEEEKILPIGREITAVGLLARNSEGFPVIKSCPHLPCFLTECNREQLITELATGSKVLLWTGLVLTSVAAGVLSYAIFRNWCRWKEWRRERERMEGVNREREIEEVEGEEEEESGEVPDGELCVVCLLHRRRAAFVSCGHRVCCMRCAHRVERNIHAKCPVCRHSVTGVIRIYDA